MPWHGKTNQVEPRPSPWTTRSWIGRKLPAQCPSYIHNSWANDFWPIGPSWPRRRSRLSFKVKAGYKCHLSAYEMPLTLFIYRIKNAYITIYTIMKGQISILNQNISISINIGGGNLIGNKMRLVPCLSWGSRRKPRQPFQSVFPCHKCLIKGRGFLKPIEVPFLESKDLESSRVSVLPDLYHAITPV